MSAMDQEQYRLAFVEYLRRGTPIRLGRKQVQGNGQYVWRTQDDNKVRPAHMANEGHIFSWDAPPETGHPGADYNCRCQAIPYVPGETEFAFHTMSELETSSSYRWIDLDFMAHYYYGNGTAVTLSEIGHLRDIAEQYAYADGKEGAFRRLSDQIADEARKVRSGSLAYYFDYAFDFGSVQFSHGGGVAKGTFDGTVANDGGMLRIAGRSFFAFSDQFADPLGLGIEVGGVPYDITGVWSATFLAEVLLNAESSHFTVREAE